MNATRFLPIRLKHCLYCLRAAKYYRHAGVGMIHVPKSAGTSMARALYGRSLGHFTFDEFARFTRFTKLRNSEIPLFAVIREPQDRFLSAYRFYCQQGTEDAGINMLHPRRHVWRHDLDAFLDEYLLATPDAARDYVFQTQTRFITSEIHNALSLKLFTFEQVPELQIWIEEQTKLPVHFERANQSDRRADPVLSARQRLVISKVYSRDFEIYAALARYRPE